MKARVTFNGQLSDEIPTENGVKQGDIPAPTLLLTYAFGNCENGVLL